MGRSLDSVVAQRTGAERAPEVLRDLTHASASSTIVVGWAGRESPIQERLRQLSDRSARDVERLLTIRQFYVRVLDRIDPGPTEAVMVARARQLVLVAEIVIRWPAHQTALRRTHPSRAGAPTRVLQLLTDAAHADDAWQAATAAVLPDPPAGLRALMRDDDAAKVVALYARVT